MKITILNKNLLLPSVPNPYLSAKSYYIDEAPIFTEIKNETLDSGIVIISNVTQKIILEPYDVVKITDDDGNFIKYMCVDTYTETITCVKPKIYKYEITLFSETKQLEGIILPNLKITKLFNVTRTVWFYINQYMTEYCPKIKVDNGLGSFTYQNRWDWSGLESKFNTITCPEMQWNTPTLREVLNDLMMVADCIPVIKSTATSCQISFMDLTEINKDGAGHPITHDEDTHINYVSRSKSSEDYVSELQVNLVNITNNTEGVNNLVTKAEYFVFGASEEKATATSKDKTVRTKYPIYNLKSLIMMVPVCYNDGGGTTHYEWVKIDLTIYSLISEYKNWITKPVYYSTGYPSFTDFYKYQNYSLFYTRGSNEIQNFGETEEIIGISGFELYQIILDQVVKQRGGTGTTMSSMPEWYNVLFSVEYETLEGCVFRASKGENPDNERVVIDNQTNSYVDSYSQGFLEYQKANRLGNEQLQINARYPSDEEPMKIGDMYEDCVIYQCQYQYYKDHTEVNALATKNYILREYFTGVKSKIRSWQVVSGDEALIRHDIQKFYCEFSYKPHIDLVDTSYFLIDEYGYDSLLSPLSTYTAAPLRYCFIRTYTPQNYYQPRVSSGDDNKYFLIDCISRVVGNSLVFSTGFDDNYVGGKSYHTINDYYQQTDDHAIWPGAIINDVNNIEFDVGENILVDGGVPMHQHSYTDEFGLCSQYELTFTASLRYLKSYNEPTDGTVWSTGSLNQLETQSRNFLFYSYMRPVAYEWTFKNDSPFYNYREFATTITHKKDSAEIAKLSLQLEFCSETTDICFGKEWLRRQRSIAIVNNSRVNYKFVLYSKFRYDFRNPNQVLQTVERIESSFSRTISYSNSDQNATITFVLQESDFIRSTQEEAKTLAESLASRYCFYLIDGNITDNKVILAFNNVPKDNCDGSGSGSTWYPSFTLYFNVLRSRNKNIYDSTNHYLINRKM